MSNAHVIVTKEQFKQLQRFLTPHQFETLGTILHNDEINSSIKASELSRVQILACDEAQMATLHTYLGYHSMGDCRDHILNTEGLFKHSRMAWIVLNADHDISIQFTPKEAAAIEQLIDENTEYDCTQAGKIATITFTPLNVETWKIISQYLSLPVLGQMKPEETLYYSKNVAEMIQQTKKHEESAFSYTKSRLYVAGSFTAVAIGMGLFRAGTHPVVQKAISGLYPFLATILTSQIAPYLLAFTILALVVLASWTYYRRVHEPTPIMSLNP